MRGLNLFVYARSRQIPNTSEKVKFSLFLFKNNIISMEKIIFFDTETTGVPRNYQAPITDISNWPRLVQLAWILANVDGSVINKCSYIIYPDSFTIPIDASNVHGITTECARCYGRNIAYVLALFMQDLGRANRIVGHNIDFDLHIVGAELYRLSWSYSQLFNLPVTCTMKSSINYCKLPPFRYGEYKWPKLEELHIKLFGCTFSGVHDAMTDIEVTKKCYFELIRQQVVYDYSLCQIGVNEQINMSQIRIIESGQCGNNVFYELDQNGLLTIYGSGPMFDYDFYNYEAQARTCGFEGQDGPTSESPFYYKGKIITNIIIKNGVTRIGVGAFACCSAVSIIIPNSIISIGVGAFFCCESLLSIIIPNSVVTIEDDVFWGCKSLTSIIIPNSVTNIGGGVFWECSKLTNLVLSNNIIEIPTKRCYHRYGYEWRYPCFEGCKSLKTIMLGDNMYPIPNELFYLSKGGRYKKMDTLLSIYVSDSNLYYSSIDGVLYNKNQTKLLICPAGKSFILISNKVISIEHGAFGDCSFLRSIIIPNSVISIGNETFNNCSSLNSITIPNSVTEIGDYAFSGCSSLNSITIPNSVTEIGDYAFSGCSSLNSITIPNSVTKIGDYAFSDCSSLCEVYLKNPVPPILGRNDFNHTKIEIIYVPTAFVDVYKKVYYAWVKYYNIKIVGCDL